MNSEQYHSILIGRLANVRDCKLIPTSHHSDSALLTLEKMVAYIVAEQKTTRTELITSHNADVMNLNLPIDNEPKTT